MSSKYLIKGISRNYADLVNAWPHDDPFWTEKLLYILLLSRKVIIIVKVQIKVPLVSDGTFLQSNIPPLYVRRSDYSFIVILICTRNTTTLTILPWIHN